MYENGMYERRLEGRKFRQKYYIGCMRDASTEGNFANNIIPSKKNGRNLCVCTGLEPLGVNINFRQFLTGYWMYDRRLEGRKFRQKYYIRCMRDASREGNFAKSIIWDV